LLLVLDEYWKGHPDLHNVPIYYASSLARKCMAVYQTYIHTMNSNIRTRFARRDNPFVFKCVYYSFHQIHITLAHRYSLQTHFTCPANTGTREKDRRRSSVRCPCQLRIHASWPQPRIIRTLCPRCAEWLDHHWILDRGYTRCECQIWGGYLLFPVHNMQQSTSFPPILCPIFRFCILSIPLISGV
jgi:hypothetical protein